MRGNTWLSWSSGKDSAWTPQVLRQSGEHEVTGLFTTINPMCAQPLDIEMGEVVTRDGFVFADCRLRTLRR
jgi:hypothetical protein